MTSSSPLFASTFIVHRSHLSFVRPVRDPESLLSFLPKTLDRLRGLTGGPKHDRSPGPEGGNEWMVEGP